MDFKQRKNNEIEFFDVTADVGYIAHGKTLNESFENSALAMFQVMTDTEKIDKKLEEKVNIEAEDLVSLLYEWLEELLIRSEIDLKLYSDFKVKIAKYDNYKLNATIKGEEIDLNKHSINSEVKAVTFHMMKVEKKDNDYISRVILDL